MPETEVAGVAGLPQASNINECDTKSGVDCPAETAVNPSECRTFAPDPEMEKLRKAVQSLVAQRDPSQAIRSMRNDRGQVDLHAMEIDRRLSDALYEAGRSALGMPSSLDTVKAMLAKAGLALVLA